MGGAFLQTSNAGVLRQVAQSLDSDERDIVVAFLEQSEDYAPASGQIVGMLCSF